MNIDILTEKENVFFYSTFIQQ